MRQASLTTPDLVVLSLLAERPMHGYDVVRELEYREVQDWAGISRPQVYYSLKKLERARLIAPAKDKAPATGPDRRVFKTTSRARAALAHALTPAHWATTRPPPPFVTWLVLSQHARQTTRRAMIGKRRSYLQRELEKERRTLVAVENDPGPMQRVALAVVTLGIRQFETELAWLEEIASALAGSQPAKAV